MTLLTLERFYWIGGLMLAGVSLRILCDSAHPRRWGAGSFWGILALLFIVGKAMSAVAVGYAVILLVALAATGRSGGRKVAVRSTGASAGESARLGFRIFWPALLIPVVAVVGPKLFGGVGRWTYWKWIDEKQAPLISLCLGATIALGFAYRVTRARRGEALEEGSRLLEALGWSLVLPQLLAALGGIFATAGVGSVIAHLVESALPVPGPLVAILAYCFGMVLFTMCLGNAFAAFAVITGGIGLPFIVKLHGGNPAIVGAIGMLSGYCGTLVTPMAANFNLVPVLLLELPDRHAVIKAQAPLAAVILTANILILWFAVYRF